MTKRLAALTAGFVLLGVGLEAGAAYAVQRRVDSRHYVTDVRLRGALETFRPSERAGLAEPVPLSDLAPELSVRSDPGRCAPLVLLATGPPASAATWSGISGEPAEPVMTLTARYADAAGARRALRAKRAALLRCPAMQLTFPPFTRPAERFRPTGRAPWTFVSSRMAYGLANGEDRYTFYVRRFGNTVTWTYGRPDTAGVRRAVVDDLVDRLAELARE